MTSKKSVLCLCVISIKSYIEKTKRHNCCEKFPRLILLACTVNLCEAYPVIVDISSALHLLMLALVTESTASVV